MWKKRIQTGVTVCLAVICLLVGCWSLFGEAVTAGIEKKKITGNWKKIGEAFDDWEEIEFYKDGTGTLISADETYKFRYALLSGSGARAVCFIFEDEDGVEHDQISVYRRNEDQLELDISDIIKKYRRVR